MKIYKETKKPREKTKRFDLLFLPSWFPNKTIIINFKGAETLRV